MERFLFLSLSPITVLDGCESIIGSLFLHPCLRSFVLSFCLPACLPACLSCGHVSPFTMIIFDFKAGLNEGEGKKRRTICKFCSVQINNEEKCTQGSKPEIARRTGEESKRKKNRKGKERRNAANLTSNFFTFVQRKQRKQREQSSERKLVARSARD